MSGWEADEEDLFFEEFCLSQPCFSARLGEEDAKDPDQAPDEYFPDYGSDFDDAFVEECDRAIKASVGECCDQVGKLANNTENLDTTTEEPPAKKARVSLGDSSITSFFKPKLDASQGSMDSTEQVILRIGLTDKLYKKAEAYTSKDLSGCILTTESFKVEGTIKAATISHICCYLRDTFIGEDEAEKLINDPAWKHNRHSYDKVHCLDIAAILGKDTIPVRRLHKRVESITLPPALRWDAGPKHQKSAGFNFAYQYSGQLFCKRKSPLRKPVVLELFGGAGGMSLGLKKAGFHVKYIVEADPHAVATLRANHDMSETIVYEETVETFFQKVLNRERGYPQPGDADYIHASPPCQGFSGANRNGGINDVRNNMLSLYLVKLVDFMVPKFATLENVNGILSEKMEKRLAKVYEEIIHCNGEQKDKESKPRAKKSYLQELVAGLLKPKLDETNQISKPTYQVRVCIVDSSHYGDPQMRSRVILFAAQEGYLLPNKPLPTHGEGLKKIVTCSDVLSDLAQIDPTKGSGLVELPSKELVHDHNGEGLDVKAECDVLEPHLPAKTIRCANGVKHYLHNRELTVRERARLQSFPDNYHFCGSQADKRTQIGNAIPVNMGFGVGQSVMESYEQEPVSAGYS